MLYWHRPYSTVVHGGFEFGDTAWFPEGGLNASYNCVDRWAYKHPEKVRRSFVSHECIAPLNPNETHQTAIIWEADELGESVEISYGKLLQEVCRVANVLKSLGVKKGDVSIYARSHKGSSLN